MPVVDAGGHTDSARRVFLSPDGKQVITVSLDKTVRIWDVANGETLRVHRLPAGRGVRGMLRAAALSPDGKWLAVAGQRADPSLGVGPVYVLNLQSGRIDQVLKPNLDVFDLQFSTDGRQLAAAAEKNAVIYDTRSWKQSTSLTGHKDLIKGLAFSPDGKWLATASQDGTAACWSLETGRREQDLITHRGAVDCIAWSPNGKLVATGSADGGIRVFPAPGGNFLGNLPPLHAFAASPSLETGVSSVTFAANSRHLLATGKDRLAVLFDVTTGFRRTDFRSHSNTVMHGGLSADGRLAVTTGGNAHETYVWYCSDGSLVQKFQGKGVAVWAVGWSPDGRSVAWGNQSFVPGGGMAPLERSFQLDELDFGPIPGADYRRRVHSNDTFEIGPTGRGGQLAIKEKGKEDRLFTVKDKIYSYTLLRDDRAVVGTYSGMHLVDLRTAKEIRYYAGHTTHVTSLAPSPDGRYFLSGSGDQTVRIWDPEQQEPLVSFFFADPDWIAWTQEGYYASSAGGERFMGWHINNGWEGLATYYSAGQFRRSRYRPQLIRQTLAAGSVAQALTASGQANTPSDLRALLPPQVAITMPSGLGNVKIGQKSEVRATARSVGPHPVTAMRLLVNGRPYLGEKGVRRVAQPQLGEVQASWQVELPAGHHVLVVQAESAVSQSVSPWVEAAVESAGPQQDQPSLYVLAVGIDNYPGDLRLNYAAADAVAMSQTLRARNLTAFRGIEIKEVRDQQATRRGIEAGLEWLRSKMTARDIGILFFSGHGYRHDDGGFFLVPVDFNVNDPTGSGFSGARLKQLLGDMPGRMLMVLDACHSGAAADSPRRDTRADDLIRDLVSEEYGVVVLSSSLGREVSLESAAVKHGFFTLALVEGLSGQADYNRDGLVHLLELEAHAARRVRELSRGQQNPAMAKPATVRSFPLARGPARQPPPDLDNPTNVLPGGKALDGLWQIVRHEEDNVRRDSSGRRYWAIQRDHYRFRTDTESSAPLEIRVDGSKNPGWFDIQDPEAPFLLKEKLFMPGIYALNGNELRICFKRVGKERPTEFAAPAGSKQALLVLRKVDNNPNAPPPRRVYQTAIGARQVAVLQGQHQRNDVTALAYSPDGKLLATSARDGVFLWDGATGKPLRRLVDGSGTLTKLSFSADGKWLLTASSYGNDVELFDVRNGKELLSFAPKGLQTALLSPDGTTLLLAGSTLSRHDLATAKETVLRKEAHNGLEITPDGATLLTASGNRLAVWDLAANKERLHWETGQMIIGTALSRDGKLAATGSRLDGGIKIWDAATGKELRKISDAHEDSVFSAAFSPDGKLLATASRSVEGQAYGEAKVWDVGTGKEAARLAGGPGVLCIQFSPDGKTIAAGYGGGVIVLWQLIK